MAEELPNRPERVTDQQHEEILLLLYRLDYIHGEMDELVYDVASDEYPELVETYALEDISIYAIPSKPIIVEVTYIAAEGRQQTDEYEYLPQERNLTLTKTVREYNELFEELNEEYGLLHSHKKRLYVTLFDGLRRAAGQDERVRALLRQHDAVREEIIRQRRAQFNSAEGSEVTLHKLLLREQRNEAVLLELMELLARVDADFSKNLEII